MRLQETLPVETLPLPTPFGVGQVNVFIVAVEPLTLVDAGVNTLAAENALKLGFAAKGLFLESLERILVTHGHPDHYGLVPLICNGGGQVKAYMGAREIERIADTGPVWEWSRRLQEAGFPEILLKELSKLEKRVNRVHKVAQLKCRPIQAGEAFEFRGFTLDAVLLPGHTEGHMGFLERKHGILFAGDTLLPHAYPNPLIEPILEPEGDSPSRSRHSLKHYLETLDLLQSMELRTVYPGHGPVITNPGETISFMRQHHARRLDQVNDCLTAGGVTAFDVSVVLYPAAQSYCRFLAVSEAVAHLDVLVEQGRATNEIRDDGVEYFSRA
ncbi:MAG TPA: MBL fold metallo-hydrolase [Actinomycetota bacterium]|nr:MBL fold metallo-hydrolase [Actinomycetota bacterium]